MSDNTPWWFDLSEEEIGMELAEEARQNELAEAVYQEILALPPAIGTEEF